MAIAHQSLALEAIKKGLAFDINEELIRKDLEDYDILAEPIRANGTRSCGIEDAYEKLSRIQAVERL